jgi:hypothetical protein
MQSCTGIMLTTLGNTPRIIDFMALVGLTNACSGPLASLAAADARRWATQSGESRRVCEIKDLQP